MIALGLRPGLNAHALVVAGRIRPVDVDHGETSCTTPDAVDYIQRTLARTAARSR